VATRVLPLIPAVEFRGVAGAFLPRYRSAAFWIVVLHFPTALSTFHAVILSAS
jgi:hypothetical protein